MPFALGELVSILEDRSSDRSPWPILFLYVALRFLQGSGGLAAIRDVSVIHIVTSQVAERLVTVILGTRNAVLRPW